MQKNTLYINKGKIIATSVVLLVIFMLFKACGGPNLEVSVETSTTNLQQEAGWAVCLIGDKLGRLIIKNKSSKWFRLKMMI